MDSIAIGFWGAFFGSVVLMLAGALVAYARSRQRVALTAALSSLVSALFVVAYLGWFPVGDASVQARVLAHVATLASVVLAMMLLAMLGALRKREVAHAIWRGMASIGVLVLATGWLLEPAQSLVLSSGMAIFTGLAMLFICVRSAQRGDRLAWISVSGVTCMLVAVAGLSWIALSPHGAPWPVHALSAVAGMAYLATMAAALWVRYSYLIELREAVSHGPRYDPVTRMRSHAETGQMVGLAFYRRHDDREQPVGVIVVSIGNLYTLENLHGRGALNHALFVCASRLRRCVPGNVEMGRLGDDGFLLLVREVSQVQRLVHLGRIVAERLSRPVALGTGDASQEPGQGKTEWEAQLGVGVLASTAQVRPSDAISMTRAMSRTAWSYTSRVAWYDLAAGRISEVPLADAA